MKIDIMHLHALEKLINTNMTGIARLKALWHIKQAKTDGEARSEEIKQKKYETRTMGEESRQKAREESITRPTEYYTYTNGLKKIYINYDKRKKQYFVQIIDEEHYKKRNERIKCKNFWEAREKYIEEVSKEVLIF